MKENSEFKRTCTYQEDKLIKCCLRAGRKHKVEFRVDTEFREATNGSIGRQRFTY